MPKSYVVDMDGVIYHGHRLIPGALDFVASRLRAGGHRFLFLTNNSQWTPRDLRHRLDQMGIQVEESAFHTAALATAEFLHQQKPGGHRPTLRSEAGLTNALYGVGYGTLTERNPDYVVVGDTRSYDYEKIERAVRLILGGARFIATNLDVTGPSEQGLQPACGALVAPIELATGRKPYFIGKPNPLMMRTALRKLELPLGRVVHGRRSDGYRHHRRNRGRDAHDPGSLGRQLARDDRGLSHPPFVRLRGRRPYSRR